MSFVSVLKKALVSACYAFSAIIVAYSLIVIAFFDGLGMEPFSVLFFFPLAFAFSLANGIVRHSVAKGGKKLIIHFLIITSALILFVFLPRGGMLSSGTSLIIFAAYLIIYAVCAGIYVAKVSKRKKQQEKNTEYKKVF